MARLKTHAKKKVNKALTRVEKVVVMEIRNQISQQRKWKAEVMKKTRIAVSNQSHNHVEVVSS